MRNRISNVGDLDKVLRKSLGMMVIGLGLYYKNWLGLAGIAPLITAYINYCPLYTFGKRKTTRIN